MKLDPISILLPDPSDQLSPQVIQKILKANGAGKSKSKIHLGIHLCTSFPYGFQPTIFGLANQKLLANLPPYFSKQFCMVHNQNTWSY